MLLNFVLYFFLCSVYLAIVYYFCIFIYYKYINELMNDLITDVSIYQVEIEEIILA